MAASMRPDNGFRGLHEFASGTRVVRLPRARRRRVVQGRKLSVRPPRLVELSYDTLGYLEQNVSPRLALETFLLECRKAS